MEYKKTAVDFLSTAVFLFAFVLGNFGAVLLKTLLSAFRSF